MLTEKSGQLEPAVMEDSCVTAMFAAAQVFMGNKVNVVLSSDLYLHDQTKNWSDFYQHLGISLNTNMNKLTASQGNVYEADIVYGKLDDFISDYFQCGLEVTETGKSHLSREFIIEKRSLSSSHTLKFERLKESGALTFAAEILQGLISDRHYKEDCISIMKILHLIETYQVN